jgi:dynein heavy chain
MIEGSNEQKPQNDSEQPAQPQQENPQVEEVQNEKPQNQPPEHEETQSKKTFERKKTQKEQQQKVESEKTEEEEQSQKHHGPKDILFIRNQKISQKESLNQKRYFWNQPNLLNGKPNYPRIANPRIAQKENFFKNQYENSKEQTTSQLPPSRFIKSENYTKLDYHELDPLKEDAYAIMNGKYSSKREGIAYINPKANEPHELIDGRPPRKVMIDRMRKVYATINIETLLKQADIDFSTVSPLDSWLPLEFFEDKDLDIFTSNEWIEKAKDPQLGQLYIQGVGLYRDNDGVGTWKRVLINNYNKDTEKYEGIWDNDAEPKENCALSKIYLLFDAENPFLFCKKVKLASEARENAESVIRYNLYVDRMLNENLPDINEDVRKRLQNNIKKLPFLKMDQKNVDDLLRDLNNNYLRTTNKIIFDKFYYSNLSNLLIIDNLKLPPEIINNPDIHKIEVREKGLEPIPPYNYITSYKSFTFKTLFCKKEIVDCLQKIKEECNKIKNSNTIFNFDIKKPLRLQEFKSRQKASIINVGKKLDEWVKIIKDTLEKSLTGVGKGSFNLNVASKEIYEYLKLKKYMTVVKCLMQDVLHSLVTKSMSNYVKFFQHFIPEKVEIKDVNDVNNIFKEEIVEEEMNTTNDLINVEEVESGPVKEPSETMGDEEDFFYDTNKYMALFQINIIKKDEKNLEYTTKEADLIKDIMQIFDDGLERMQKISQVEPLLLPNLIKAGKNGIPLKTITRPKGGKPAPKTKEEIKEGFELNEDAIWICEQYEDLVESLKKACEPLTPYLETFGKYKELIELDPFHRLKEIKDDETKDVEERQWTYQKIKEDIIENKKKEEKILNEIPKVIHVSFFMINAREYRNELASKFNKLADMEMEYLKEKAKDLNGNIQTGYAQMAHEITREVVTINDLKEVQNYIATIPMELNKLKERTVQVEEIYNILDGFNVKLDYIQFEQRMNLMRGPTDIEMIKEEKLIQLEKKKEQLAQEQIEKVNELMDNINNLEANIHELAKYNDESKAESAKTLAVYIKGKVEEYKKDGIMYNEREMLFGKPRTDWSKIQELDGMLAPYYNLWVGLDRWNSSQKRWLEGDFSLLDGNEIDSTITELTKNFNMALSRFKSENVEEAIFNICMKYKKKVDEFKPQGELAVALTRGLKDRHWEEIKKKTGIDCTPRKGFTFQNILDEGMIKHLEICADVGEKAYREAKIEEQLIAIDKKWKDIFFALTEHKLTKLPTISNWNDINKELDTDIMDVQQLDLSPFKGPFAEQITKWNKDLLLISMVLEEWNKCQRSWIYLQPVFDSGDIAKDIPYEHKKFKMTDRMWQDLMNSLNTNRNVKQCCLQEGLFEKLKDANNNLENVEKGLNDYMEKKRAIFPRFYFISNAQFLEILSQTKDIKKVKDNVNKIFEPIDSITLKDDMYITAILSRFGEKLDLCEQVTIHGQNVEQWMKKLEGQMFKTVHHYMSLCVEDYLKNPRKEWVKHHPGQLIMAVNQIMWTKEVEKHILEHTLEDYIHEYESRILDLVDLVREKQTRVMSINLANLITLDVHNSNVMKNLVSKNIQKTNAFDWIMQMRYYWDQSLKPDEYNCVVKSVQTDFPYGYEYVGNAEILVITPLTDKCNLTLMGALRLNLGGAPAGPAGTGKTETTKDLARTLGKLCIVYNCSDDTDYVMIGKFFKGLACCGAWICFDEFNRINIEVLSVIAQQLLTLFGAKDKNQTEIVFEGSTIRILPTFCVFITMNPGYAGRTELPDNLKALFRSISMMVPDYKLIAEINLYSSGYVQANELATKVVSTMKLSSEQLSTQGHYDFGMRAVKSVLNAARRLKRTETDKPEDQLLLRALEDVNVPKFVKEDIPLFRNIISDLFPRTTRPKIDYGDLLNEVDKVCESSQYNLIPSQAFKDKIIQLYDTLQVRHGLMIVGPAGGGKTSNYNVLKESISRLADDKVFFKTQTNIINPKAITHAELYSEQNTDTGEWSFGIVPVIINECKRDTAGKTKYWIIFDGPVDAMWIEDMNSVLDDSKKLCLASSDIILLNDMITIMFEVEDLVVASPATVSRCGMVYMEPSSLGIQPLYVCWIKKLIEMLETLARNNANNAQQNQQKGGKEKEKKKKIEKKENPIESINKKLTQLFDSYLEDLVYFVRRKVKEPCPTVDNNLASSVMRIIDTFFDKFRSQEAQFKNMDDEVRQVEDVLEGIFYFAIIWGVGVTTNEEGRTKFNEHFRQLMSEKVMDKRFELPKSGTCYDYLFDYEKGEWIQWINIIEKLQLPHNIGYTEIIVPTPDSVRNSYVIKQLIVSNKHVITTGPTGTGKTININEVLTKGLGEKYMSIIMNFSAQTTAKQTRETIQGKIQRRGRGRYAPEKPAAIFIDDLNMPVRQDSGAQPPIELLRQWLDHSGWYNLINKQFITVENIILLGAMGLPGGGRNYLSQRFQRHFNLITYNELDDQSITMIFSTILNFFLAKFPEIIKNAIGDVIKITLDDYKEIKNVMLPTPAKMHYIFNLRDISKVLQGVSSLTLEITKERCDVARIWYHEMTRVFGDRLINDQDRNWLKELLEKGANDVFETNEELLYQYGKTIIYCDFMGADAYSKRNYNLVTDIPAFIKRINQRLEEYNEDGKKKKLKLVMFLDACGHVSRICRILRQPQGNALLLGVGGSGRQSLARLATFINTYDCYQIDVVKGYGMSDFGKNVKECLMKAGIEERSQTFLIVDTQLIHSLMLEYINGILNTGDVPNIYAEQSDKDAIINAVRAEVMTKYGNLMESNVMKVYLNRVQKHIHVVLAMSPLGGAFINRLRMFPSLVNCCTLDWFSEWPEDALESVAMDNFKEDSLGLDDDTIPKVVNAFKFIHKRVEGESKSYSEQMRRYVYLTPTSYLELLSLYSKIIQAKTKEFNKSINRFESGLTVLNSANVEVGKMQEQIEKQRPLLKKATEETEKLVSVLTVKKDEAEKKKATAQEEEAKAKKLDEECTATLAICEAEKEKVRPLIVKAKNSINKVQPQHLEESNSYKKLTEGGEILFTGLLIFLAGNDWKIKEYEIKDQTNPDGSKMYDIKKALAFIEFNKTGELLKKLRNFCDTIEILEVDPMKSHIKELVKYFTNRKVTKKIIENAAKSLVGMYEYMMLLAEYLENFENIIQPVQIKFDKATEDKNNSIRAKESAIKQSREAEEEVRQLDDNYKKAMDEQASLSKQVKTAEEKLRRATLLISLLSGEQARWTKNVADLKLQVANLAGDSLMAAAAICYNGPFIYSYRVNLENDWRKKIEELDIIHTEGITMKGLLENPIEVNEWKLNGLPNDNLSIENGIIIKNTRRWPLMIDPQNQGSNYIKKFGKRQECLVVIKGSDQNFLNLIKGAIRAEKWVLLENVSENLDPTLEPILNQQTIQTGTSVEIKIGEDLIPWSTKFKLHLSTTIPNPHYSPETFVKVTIVNFGITPQGLQEQMMTLLINNEMPELEQRKNAILIENFESMAELKATEDKILNALEGGNIAKFLENDDLIDQLKESKTKSEEISQKIEESKETTIKIDNEREKYRPAAERSSILFFATLDLSSIDPMYQFSLQWFSKLYEFSIKTTPNSNNKDIRIANLNKIFTKNLYENVCRSLFEKDKLLFSFVICQKIIVGTTDHPVSIPNNEWRYFLAGPSGDVEIPTNPTDWINKNEWPTFYRQLHYMDVNFEETKEIENHFMKNPNDWKDLYDSHTPQSDPLPGEWEEKINNFTKTAHFIKLMIIKMIRPDKLINSIQLWIENNIGKEFIEPPPFELAKSYKQSSNIVPLIFILSPGSDPINDIKKFAEDQGYDKNKFDTVSLGRGQEGKAMKVLEDMRTRGGWVLLQNCHLAKSFMSKLEEIVENFDTNWPDKDFRLWLTSMSNPFFPVSILQNSVKITVEPPKGLKNNILRNYKKIEPKDLEDDCLKRNEYKTLLFGLSFFHAIVQDRRKYGPIGWNVRYDFTNEDWMVSRKQIKIFLEEYENIPYQVLDYLIGDINYGGRVTDDKDQRLIKTILNTYLNEKIFQYSKYKFSKSGIYYCPEPGEHDAYLTYIENLPVNSEPEVFGLHDNADIITAQNEGAELLNTVLGIQPRQSSSGGKSQESMILELLDDIRKKTPEPFDREAVFKQFPTDYNESLNTVLLQEVIRYNVLLNVMKTSIVTLEKGLTGRIVMDEETEEMSQSLYINQVPSSWSKVFLSLKPLSSWLIDLDQRIKFFQEWISSGKTPNTFWFSGFSFPQAFMTAVLQNYARSSKTAIDLLTFDFKILDDKKPSDITEKPENGVYVYGMFLEGARWNYDTHLLDDSLPKELYTDVPMIHFIPVADRVLPTEGVYFCPLYKVLSRAGTLSTTGHSTNYILFVELPSDKPQSVWIKAGVAMFLSLKQ